MITKTTQTADWHAEPYWHFPEGASKCVLIVQSQFTVSYPEGSGSGLQQVRGNGGAAERAGCASSLEVCQQPTHDALKGALGSLALFQVLLSRIVKLVRSDKRRALHFEQTLLPVAVSSEHSCKQLRIPLLSCVQLNQHLLPLTRKAADMWDLQILRQLHSCMHWHSAWPRSHCLPAPTLEALPCRCQILYTLCKEADCQALC